MSLADVSPDALWGESLGIPPIPPFPSFTFSCSDGFLQVSVKLFLISRICSSDTVLCGPLLGGSHVQLPALCFTFCFGNTIMSPCMSTTHLTVCCMAVILLESGLAISTIVLSCFSVWSLNMYMRSLWYVSIGWCEWNEIHMCVGTSTAAALHQLSVLYKLLLYFEGLVLFLQLRSQIHASQSSQTSQCVVTPKHIYLYSGSDLCLSLCSSSSSFSTCDDDTWHPC